MSVRWSPAARDDLLGAVEHYRDAGSAEVAEQFLDGVERAIELLADGRFDGPEVVVTSGARVRVWSVGTHYRLYYRRGDERIEIVRLFHGRRRPVEVR